MSNCQAYAEFLATLCLETGARPHIVAPLARRLRRLATSHARRCVVQCNGCRTCHGMGGVIDLFSTRVAHEYPTSHPDARPCPQCSTDTLEDAIRATCADLLKLLNEKREDDGSRFRENIESFAPLFQHDPHGATVRLRLPSGIGGESDYGYPVPTSGRV